MVEVTILDNGLRIITEKIPGARIVDLCVVVGVGSRHEKKEHGISHAVEHMVFNGTKTRDKADIAGAIEKRGGSLEALTFLDQTHYRVSLLKEDMHDSLDILADMVQNAVFDKKSWMNEKKVICQEIKSHGSADDLSADSIFMAAYGDKHPLNYQIAGKIGEFQRITAEQLKQHVHKYYVGANMIVSVAGDVEHEDFVRMCQSAFGSLRRGYVAHPVKAVYKGGCKMIGLASEQLGVQIGFKAPSCLDEDRFAAIMAVDILGGGLSSRLFREVREKRGLAYSVSAGVNMHKDSGLCQIYIVTEPKQMKEALPVICEEILKLSHTLTEEEVAQVKRQYFVDVVSEVEKDLNKACSNAESFLDNGVIHPVEKRLEDIAAVTREDIARVAQTMFTSKPSFGVVGPLRSSVSYDTICKYLGYKESEPLVLEAGSKGVEPTCVVKRTGRKVFGVALNEHIQGRGYSRADDR